MAVVDSLYADFMDASKVLMSANEVSLQIMLESNLRKTLLLSSASYFEHILSAAVGRFTEEATFGNAMMLTLVHSKAISRQYHTWFDWDANNANKFFKLFGKVFYDHMAAIIGENDALAGNIRAFMEIGRQRNLLVHSDYASHFIDKTPDEIYALYLSANGFVGLVESELFSCSSKIKGEIAKAVEGAT